MIPTPSAEGKAFGIRTRRELEEACSNPEHAEAAARALQLDRAGGTRLEYHIAAEVESWHGKKSLEQVGMKLAEEAGEVVGAILKAAEGRTDAADMDAEIGDVLIVLCQFAAKRGCTLEDYIVQRWATVRSRQRRREAGEMISEPIIDDLRSQVGAQKERGTKLLTRIVEAKVCCALQKETLKRDLAATHAGSTPEQPAREEAITRLWQAIHAINQIEVRLGGGGGVLVGDDNGESSSRAASPSDKMRDRP